MKSNPEVQISRVSLLSDLVNEELVEYLEYHGKMEEWGKAESLDWATRPGAVSKEKLKRLMLVLRQEMIKLDKLL